TTSPWAPRGGLLPSVVGLESGAAHGEEAVGGFAVDLAVVPVGREVGRRDVLAVDSPAGEVAARLQDPILRRGDKLHIVAVDGLENLPPPHGHADGDALGHGG